MDDERLFLITPYEAEREAERRWPGWSATAQCAGDVFVVAMMRVAGGRDSTIVAEAMGTSRDGFIEAIDALGPYRESTRPQIRPHP